MQEGDVISLQRRLAPASGQLNVEGVDAQQLRRISGIELLAHVQQGLTQAAASQDQPRLRVSDDRQQTLLMMTTRRLRRVSRHRNDTGIQATEERRDIVRTTREQQHRALAGLDLSLQRSSNDAGALIKLAITEHGAFAGVLGQKTQGNAIRLAGCTLLQGLHQSVGEFEHVVHGCSCLSPACNREFTKRGAPDARRVWLSESAGCRSG